MNSVVVKIWVGVLLFAMGGYGAFTMLRMGGYFADDAQPPEAPRKVVELKPGAALLDELADVKLVERSGANFRWSRLEGQPWVANVFFATCAKECTLLSAQVGYVQRTVPDVRFVSVTCDPDNDTPEALRKYADQYHADPARWFFLTGDMRDIRRASEVLFGLPVKRQEHAPYMALMDGEGRFVEMFSATQPDAVAELTKKIKELQDATGDERVRPTTEDTEDEHGGTRRSDE